MLVTDSFIVLFISHHTVTEIFDIFTNVSFAVVIFFTDIDWVMVLSLHRDGQW